MLTRYTDASRGWRVVQKTIGILLATPGVDAPRSSARVSRAACAIDVQRFASRTPVRLLQPSHRSQLHQLPLRLGGAHDSRAQLCARGSSLPRMQELGAPIVQSSHGRGVCGIRARSRCSATFSRREAPTRASTTRFARPVFQRGWCSALSALKLGARNACRACNFAHSKTTLSTSGGASSHENAARANRARPRNP